jgi:hypothetical protein
MNLKRQKVDYHGVREGRAKSGAPLNFTLGAYPQGGKREKGVKYHINAFTFKG